MKYNEKIIFGLLEYFADNQPHKLWEQQILMLTRYKHQFKREKIDFYKLMRYCIHSGLLMGMGDDFYKVKLPFRHFIITSKGDNYFREMQMRRSGSVSYYKYFEKDRAKNPINILE